MRRTLNKTRRRGVCGHQAERLERRVLLSVGDLELTFGGGDSVATGDAAPAAVAQPLVQGAAETSGHVDAAAVREQLVRFVDTWNGGRLGKLGTAGMGTYSPTWNGLFRTNLDQQFNPVSAYTDDMTVISQSRAVYINAEAYRNAPAVERARFKAAVQRGADYLLAKAVDPRTYNGKPGGMWWGLQDDGTSPPTHTRQIGGTLPRHKHPYGQVQALFALAHAWTVTGDARHLDGAFAQLDVWNGQFADTAAGPGAFLQTANEDYTQRVGTRNVDYMTHALEALLALDDATPAGHPRKAGVAAQVTNVGNFIATRMYRDAPGSTAMGYLPWYYDAQWNPSADPAQRYSTPGHNIEVAYLLSRAVERGFNPAWLGVANKLVAYTLRYGVDNAPASPTYGAVPNGKLAFDGTHFDPAPTELVWWQTAEAARALLHFAAIRGRTDLWDEYEAASAFIQSRFVDATYGGWFTHLDPATLAPSRTDKGDVWTGGYHETMLDAERLRVAAGDEPGGLDLTFGGGDGVATADFGGDEKALDVALLPGAKILVGASGAVVRFNPDGTLDRTFGGGDGRVGVAGDVTALAVQPGGGIVAVTPAGLARFTPDGVRDMSFGGGDGLATAPTGSGITGFADVGVQPGGRIVASPAGFIGLVGFAPAGTLDTTFGKGGSNGDGVVAADIAAPADSVDPSGGPLAVQADGSVVVAGAVDTPYDFMEGTHNALAVARFTADGLLDPTFSPGGGHYGAGLAVVEGDVTYHRALDLAVGPDGRIIVVGRQSDGPSDPTVGFDFVYRLLPDGSADGGFGTGGRAGVGDLAAGYDYSDLPVSVATQADGKVVLAGVGNVGTPEEPRFVLALLRLARAGTPDATFGPDHDGGVTTVIGQSGKAYAVAVQPDGKVLVAGTADGDIALARYQGDGVLDGDDQAAEAYFVPRPLRPVESRAIDGPTDVDLYRFDVAAGRRIGFDVDKSAGSAVNAYLRVFGPTGTQLGSNDDAAAPGESAAGGDPYLEVTFPAAGTYYVGVSSKGNAAYNPVSGAGDAAGGSTGGYSLTLADRTPRAVGDYDFDFGFDGVAPPMSGGLADQHEGGITLLPAGGYVAANSLSNRFDPREESDNDDLAVTRYTAGGLVQTTFGPYEQGVSAPFGNMWEPVDERAEVVAALPDGRILAVGRRTAQYSLESPAIILARYDPGGALVGGRDFSVGGNDLLDRPTAVAVLPGGKFLLAGTAVVAEAAGWERPPEWQDFFVARFNADATPDTTFARGGADGDGVATIDFAGRADELAGIAVLSDGSILAAGTAATSSGTDFAVARLTAGGSLDTTFGGGDGKVTTDFGVPGGNDSGNAIVLLPGGQFAIAGGATLTDRPELALARYHPDGTLDGAFGSGGKVATRLSGPASAGAAVADGDWVLVGGRQGFGLARYAASGALDTTFGANGFAATPAGAVSQILPLPDGNWLVNGSEGRARHLAAAFPAPVPAGTRVYQAESATVSGAKVAANHAGYTGTGFVDYLRRVSDYVEFAVEVPTAGEYLLDFRYANGGTYGRPLELKVNGVVARARLPFAATGSWGRWGTSSAAVTLPAGRSTVRLTAVLVSGPNLDALTLRPPQVQTLQAEEAALSGATVETSRPGYTGTGYADYVNASGDYVEWKVNLPTAGLYELSFRYTNGGTADRPLDLSVNGQLLPSRVSFAPTGGWSAWGTSAVTLSLAEGVNTLRLTAAGLSGPNIDALAVRPAAE